MLKVSLESTKEYPEGCVQRIDLTHPQLSWLGKVSHMAAEKFVDRALGSDFLAAYSGYSVSEDEYEEVEDDE
jgi:hypothetical protein